MIFLKQEDWFFKNTFDVLLHFEKNKSSNIPKKLAKNEEKKSQDTKWLTFFIAISLDSATVARSVKWHFWLFQNLEFMTWHFLFFNFTIVHNNFQFIVYNLFYRGSLAFCHSINIQCIAFSWLNKFHGQILLVAVIFTQKKCLTVVQRSYSIIFCK